MRAGRRARGRPGRRRSAGPAPPPSAASDAGAASDRRRPGAGPSQTADRRGATALLWHSTRRADRGGYEGFPGSASGSASGPTSEWRAASICRRASSASGKSPCFRALSKDLETLRLARVETVVDVRQLPISRRKGFAKNALKSALEDTDIEYVHLGGLGDPKEGRDAARAGDYSKFLKVFNAHMKTQSFAGDLEKSRGDRQGRGACLMCYERSELQCHRKLVSDEISAILGCDVKHLGVRKGISRDGTRKTARARADLGEGATARW